MRRLMLSGIVLGVLLSACDGSPTAPILGASYTLVSVDGMPLPAVLETMVVAEGVYRQLRVRGRSITFVSRDSAEYSLSRDVVEPLPGGEVETWHSHCASMRVPYQRQGNRVILTWDPNRLMAAGQPPQPIAQDTLRIEGSGLRHRAGTLSMMAGFGERSWQLHYRAGEPQSPVCPA